MGICSCNALRVPLCAAGTGARCRDTSSSNECSGSCWKPWERIHFCVLELDQASLYCVVWIYCVVLVPLKWSISDLFAGGEEPLESVMRSWGWIEFALIRILLCKIGFFVFSIEIPGTWYKIKWFAFQCSCIGHVLQHWGTLIVTVKGTSSEVVWSFLCFV